VPDYEEVIGLSFPSSSLPIEHGKIREFASALLDPSPVYRSTENARVSGFPEVPVPVTFPICAHLYSDSGGSAMSQLIERGYAERGYVLHGEQEFTYRRPVYAGETFTVTQKVVNAYRKDGSRGAIMTFFEVQTEFVDTAGCVACTGRAIVLERRPAPK
jgi:acyl dehydratase